MRNTNIHPVLISLFLVIAAITSTWGQHVHVVQGNDPVMLVADGFKHGSIQWESSTDGINWTDMSGFTQDTALFNPGSDLIWYRARITSGTCQPIWSTTRGVMRFFCGDTLIDPRDGRMYPTVQIGNQCWMGSNLNVGVMTQGIYSMKNDSIIEKYCYDDDTVSCNTYGALYQWDEMMNYTTSPGTQGICPPGWHIPTDQEVITLETALGMPLAVANLLNIWRGTDEGTKVKQGGTSGFNANLTGIRYDGGLFISEGTMEFIWTSSTHFTMPHQAYRRCLSITDPKIGRFNNTQKTMGASVRCLLNN
jgi:uncharacterized protein (TIGR02145 family)